MPCELETIEPALSAARALLMQREAATGPDAHAALRAARDYLELHRESVPEEYNLDAILTSALAILPEDRFEVRGPKSLLCRGDREQVGVAMRAAIQSIVLESDSVLFVDVVTEGDVPLVRLELDGPGAFRGEWLMGGNVYMTVDRLEPPWTRATRGGRFDRRPGAMDLRLSGIRILPDALPPPDAVLETVRTAEKMARIVAGEASSDLSSERDAALRASDMALHVIDSEVRGREPADIATMLAEAVESQRPLLAQHAIQCELEAQTDLPPIAIHRTRLRSVFVNLLLHATEAFTRGGSVSILLDYDSRSRRVELLVDLEGTQYDRSRTRLLASIRRSVEDVHGGVLSLAIHDRGMAASIAVPDPVGRELDAWMPGFDCFSSRSRQMLRLLKSGGPTPPEDFLLGGILEEELERMLLPRLSVAPATNLAHALKPVLSGLPGSSADRLEKALGQIRKGRPKKEICTPPYAAEILWAFRADDRHRAAVGAAVLDEASLKTLCTGLLATPPDSVNCLRVLARCIAETEALKPRDCNR